MYIDPGIAGMVIQILVGLALAIPIFLKMNWVKVKGLAKRITDRGK